MKTKLQEKILSKELLKSSLIEKSILGGILDIDEKVKKIRVTTVFTEVAVIALFTFILMVLSEF